MRPSKHAPHLDFDSVKYAIPDPRLIAEDRATHFCSEWPMLVRRFLLEMVLKEEPRFTIGSETTYTYDASPEFAEHVRRFYMPFLEDCFDELMILGVVVVKIMAADNGDMYPVAIPSDTFGDIYDFRIFTDYNTGKVDYRIFRLKDENGLALSQPYEDVDAWVFHGMMPTPGPDRRGTIRSVVRGMAPWQRYYDRMMIFSMQAVGALLKI